MAENKKRKRSIWSMIIFLLFVGLAVGGYFFGGHLIRNDKFELLGEKQIVLRLGEQYTAEQDAVAISFGKDISKKIKRTDNIDYEKAGNYYICYTVDDIRYKNVKLYRTIVISSEVSE